MLDFHAHILPNVDDGARSIEESTRMLREAQSVGVTEIVATPHLYKRAFDREYMDEVDEAYARLRPVAEGMGIRLHRGFEVCFDAVSAEADVDFCCVRWNRPDKVMLLELDWDTYSERAPGKICEWIRRGIRPVIAHPERYQFVQEDISIVTEWRAYGCWIQCNAGSYQQPWGRKERTVIRKLLREGWIDFIASDAHRPGHYERLGKMLRAFPPDGLRTPTEASEASWADAR